MTNTQPDNDMVERVARAIIDAWELAVRQGNKDMPTGSTYSSFEFDHFIANVAKAAINAVMEAPPGYKLVPLEPTYEMLRRGADKPPWVQSRPDVEGIYKAMLDAAPEPQEET